MSINRLVLTGSLLALLSAVAYATNTPFSTWVFDGGGSPLMVVLGRSLGACVLSAVYCRVTGVPLFQTALMPVTSLLGFFLFAQGAFYIGSVNFIPVSLAALVFFTWPVLVGMVSLRSAPVASRLWQALAFGLAFGGLALALQADLSGLDPTGVVLAISGSVCMASYMLLAGRKFPRQIHPVLTNLRINFVIVLFTLAVALFLGVDLVTGALDTWKPLLAITVFYSIATLTQLLAVKRAGARLPSLIYNLEPVISILLAAAFLGERLLGQQLLGAGMVLLALLLFALASVRGREELENKAA